MTEEPVIELAVPVPPAPPLETVPVPPTPPGRNVQAAHFYFSQEGYTSRYDKEFYTIDGGYTLVSSETAPFYIQAVWTHFTEPPCYRLTSCIDPTCFIVVDNPELDIHVGDSVKLCSLIDLTCLNDPALYDEALEELESSFGHPYLI